jgi:hypothetical protein
MSVSVNIYNKIKEASFKVLCVKTYALWNNQIDKVKEGLTNSIAFPAIFITFENQYQSISSGNQQINGVFVLYIANAVIEIHGRTDSAIQGCGISDNDEGVTEASVFKT